MGESRVRQVSDQKSRLLASQTLAKLGIPRTTFYCWYDPYLQSGVAGLQVDPPGPSYGRIDW